MKRYAGMRTMVIACWVISIFIWGFSANSICEAVTPLRVAILPVLDDSRMAEQTTVQVIENILAAKFHMPLEGVVKFYDIVPPDEINAALPQPTKRGAVKPDRAMLARVADQVKADVVIGVEITSYIHRTDLSLWENEMMEETDIWLRLVGYSSADKKFMELKDHEAYYGDWSTWGDPGVLTRKIMDRFMDKIPYTYQVKPAPDSE